MSRQSKINTLISLVRSLALVLVILSLAACPTPGGGPDDHDGDPTDPAHHSSDAALSALSVSGGALDPAFDAAIMSYTARVPNASASVQVTAQAHDTTASITIDGAAVTSGAPSGSISLEVGVARSIPIVVTAEDGTTTHTYTVEVTRASVDEKAITAFVIEAQNNFVLGGRSYQGVINQSAIPPTVTIETRYITTPANLVPTITITGASVAPASGASHSFSDGVSVDYTVTAANGSQQVYEVTVNVLPMATVSGTVTLAAPDALASGKGEVHLNPQGPGAIPMGPALLTWNPDNRTASYSFTDVPEGTYQVELFIDTNSDFTLNTGDYTAEANGFSVSYTGAFTMDFPALVPVAYATVQGTVTLPAPDPGAVAAMTSVLLETGALGGTGTWVSWDADNMTGHYIFDGSVPPGTYTLRVHVDMDNNAVVSTGDYTGSASSFAVSGTATYTKDIALTQVTLAEVGGTVTLPAPDPTARASGFTASAMIDDESHTVFLMPVDMTWVTDSTLSYSFPSVPAGTYTVRIFIDKDGDMAPSNGDYQGTAAGVVVPASGAVTANINATVMVLASITGTLTIPAAGADGMMVFISLVSDDYTAGAQTMLLWTTGTTQTYSLTSPGAGTYILRVFVDMDGNMGPSTGDYVGYYGGSGVLPPAAVNLTVPASGTVPNVNVTLSAFPAASASISGIVTLPSGSPNGLHWMVCASTGPTMASVVAYTDDFWAGTGMTQSYMIPGLVAGTYYVWFVIDMDGDDTPFTAGDLMGFHGGSGANPPAAANVVLAAGQAKTGVDITQAGNP